MWSLGIQSPAEAAWMMSQAKRHAMLMWQLGGRWLPLRNTAECSVEGSAVEPKLHALTRQQQPQRYGTGDLAAAARSGGANPVKAIATRIMTVKTASIASSATDSPQFPAAAVEANGTATITTSALHKLTLLLHHRLSVKLMTV